MYVIRMKITFKNCFQSKVEKHRHGRTNNIRMNFKEINNYNNVSQDISNEDQSRGFVHMAMNCRIPYALQKETSITTPLQIS